MDLEWLEDSSNLFIAMADLLNCVLLLQELRLLKSSAECLKCGNAMKLESSGDRSMDKYMW